MKNKKTIMISGAKGKMGSFLVTHLAKEHKIIPVDIDTDWKKLLDGNIHLIIDFSEANHAIKLIEEACKKHVPILSGTTGIDQNTKQRLIKLAKRKHNSLVFCSNLSSGIKQIYQFCKKLSTNDLSIKAITLEESHHFTKRDTPSGTSLMIANIFGIGKEKIISHRIDEYIPTQKITIEIPGEEITITHRAITKDCYLKNIRYYIDHMSRYKLIEDDYQKK